MQPQQQNEGQPGTGRNPSRVRRCRIGRAFFSMALLIPLLGAGNAAALSSLDPLLDPIRLQHRLPALAAAVVVDGNVIAAGAVGVRKEGDRHRVGLRDRWHIGSCTKSMTASLAALLIQEGRLRWDTRVPELFPHLQEDLRTEWRVVTLEQLLKNQAGAPESLEAGGLWNELWLRHGLPPLEQRNYLAQVLLTRWTPQATPGTRFLYSNAGFALAGNALERSLGQPWEELLVKRLTRPMGLRSVGFGCPASPGKLNGPWGHHRGPNGENVPDPPGLNGDNPAAIGPGGTVHCDILDLAKYARWHLRGARGESTLLRQEGFTRLHTPYAGGGPTTYAAGWNVVPRSWGHGDVLTHTGSNTKNFSVIWIAPKRNFAVVVCTNLGGDGAAQATDETAAGLIQKYLGSGKAN